MSILSKAKAGVAVEPAAPISEVLPALALYGAGALLNVDESAVVFRDLIRQWLIGVRWVGEHPYEGWYKTLRWVSGFPQVVHDWREVFVPADIPRSGEIWELLENIGRCCGCEVYLVGGAVRDLVRQDKLPVELDVVLGRWGEGVKECVVGSGVELKASFPLSLKGNYKSHFLDFTFSRYDYYPKPGRMPIVVKADVLADLERRDFTISAVALMVYPKFGWVDPFGGLPLLRRGILRLVRSYAFKEDPARIVRMVKYSVKCGFGVDTEAERQARAALGSMGGYVSRRLWLELKDLYLTAGKMGLNLLGGYGFWQAVLEVTTEDVLRVVSSTGWRGLLELAWRRYEKLGYSPYVLRSIFKGM